MNETTVRVSLWLNENIGTHMIYDSRELAKEFKTETGYDACWPEHSTAETASRMQARGLGGSIQQEEKPNAYGWEIAEALATNLAKWPGTFQSGRGSRFRAAVQALEQAGF